MNGSTIRLSSEHKLQLDSLMDQYVLDAFNSDQIDLIRSIRRQGLSYDSFLSILIKSYRREK